VISVRLSLTVTKSECDEILLIMLFLILNGVYAQLVSRKRRCVRIKETKINRY